MPFREFRGLKLYERAIRFKPGNRHVQQVLPGSTSSFCNARRDSEYCGSSHGEQIQIRKVDGGSCNHNSNTPRNHRLTTHSYLERGRSSSSTRSTAKAVTAFSAHHSFPQRGSPSCVRLCFYFCCLQLHCASGGAALRAREYRMARCLDSRQRYIRSVARMSLTA